MPPAPELPESHRAPEYLYTLVAGFGGVAKYARQYLITNRFQVSHLIANVAISAFSGFMFGEVALSLGWSYEGTIAAAGVGGYVGSEGIMFLWATLKKHVK